MYLQNPNEIYEKIQQRRNQVFKHNFGIQPFIILCGNVENITASYTFIDDQLYMTDSPVKALDLTFKIIFALNTQYSPECCNVWTFIQKYVYEINTDCDKHFSSLDILRQTLLN
jgi:hypothetical protein